MPRAIHALPDRIPGPIERLGDGWLLGLLGRLIFAGVLLMYFLNSAFTKFDGGPFSVSDAAYFQIIPPIVEAAGYDASAVPFFPWGLVVLLGTYGEVILPILLVLGLFTRLSALGMLIFIGVQSYVDIAFHGADAATVGVWFDNLSNAAIVDQRAFWAFLFVHLAIKGGGAVSIDGLIRRRRAARAEEEPVSYGAA